MDIASLKNVSGNIDLNKYTGMYDELDIHKISWKYIKLLPEGESPEFYFYFANIEDVKSFDEFLAINLKIACSEFKYINIINNSGNRLSPKECFNYEICDEQEIYNQVDPEILEDLLDVMPKACFDLIADYLNMNKSLIGIGTDDLYSGYCVSDSRVLMQYVSLWP